MALGLAHRVGAEVEGHDLVVRVAMDAMDHVAAHLPEADEPELHQSISFTRWVRSRIALGDSPSSRTCTAGRPWSLQREQVADRLGVLQCRNVYPAPGISTSSSPSCTSWMNRPVGGPPLCSWPVEWR